MALRFGLCSRTMISSINQIRSSTIGILQSKQVLLIQNVRVQPLIIVGKQYSSVADKNFGSEIYDGPLASRIRSVKIFSILTSIVGLSAQPLFINKILEDQTNIGIAIASGVILQFFTFVTPVLFHFISKRYVRAIFYSADNDTYTALTYDFLTRTKLIQFKVDDVVVPEIPGMFSSIIVKDNPLFIDVNYFRDIGHYKRILGLDKPIDFRLTEKTQKPS